MKAVFVVCMIFLVLALSYNIAVATEIFDEQQKKIMEYLDAGSSGAQAALPGNFTEDEISHLNDVKLVMFWLDAVSLVLFLAAAGTGFFLYNKHELYASLFVSGIAGIGVLMIVLLFALLDFPLLFTYFHKLFFAEGTWLFPNESLLIQTFTFEFFIGITKRILITAVALFIILAALGYSLNRSRNNR